MKLMMLIERATTTMRLPSPPTHHPINENPRKRKSRRPNPEGEDQESGDSLPRNPKKILRLFGVDIPIYQEAIIPQNYDQEEAPAPAPAPISPLPPQLNQEEAEATIPQNYDQEEAPAPAPISPPPPQLNQEEEEAIIPQNYDQEKAPAPAPISPPPPQLNQEEEAIIPQNHDQEEAPAPAPISSPPPQLNQEEEEAIIPQNPIEETAPAPMDNYPVYHLLFEKELTSSDVARAHNRLLVTGSQTLMKALTEEERGRVQMNSADGFLRVVARDVNGGRYMLRLKKWAGSGAIVLKHEWGNLVRANGLQRGDLVRGWGYRVCGELELVINFVRN